MSNNNQLPAPEKDEFSIEQFEKSLDKYKKKEPDSDNMHSCNYLFYGYDNELEKNFNEQLPGKNFYIDQDEKRIEKQKDLSILILKATYLQKLEEHLNSIVYLLRDVKSPIEQAMLSALMIIGYDFASTVTARHGLPHLKFRWTVGDNFDENLSNILIEPQFQIDKYKVDFLLTYRMNEKISKLIIECDGHEFHEKTKEQVARDKKRERFLQDCGYRIHRYSGSEIFKDVFDSAYQALKSVTK